MRAGHSIRITRRHNRGTREGVTAGQVFVVGESDVVRDPETGEILDESVIEVARIQAVTVRERLTIYDVISGDVAQVVAGHGVLLPGR